MVLLRNVLEGYGPSYKRYAEFIAQLVWSNGRRDKSTGKGIKFFFPIYASESILHVAKFNP